MTAVAHTRQSGPTDGRYLIVHEIAGQNPTIYRLQDIFAMRSKNVTDVRSGIAADAYDQDAWQMLDDGRFRVARGNQNQNENPQGFLQTSNSRAKR